jgi:hypothetical protein
LAAWIVAMREGAKASGGRGLAEKLEEPICLRPVDGRHGHQASMVDDASL